MVDQLGFVRWLVSKEGPISRYDRAGKAALVGQRADGRPVMGEGDHEGAYVGGARFGEMVMPRRRLSFKVVDPDKFAAWAIASGYGGEVETKQRVRPAFLEKLKKAAESSGAARGQLQMVHPRTGELVDVPGVEVALGDLVPMFTAAPDAEEILRQAHERGHLAALLGAVLAPAPLPVSEEEPREGAPVNAG
ncbi:hypothetical protein [Streptosporangium sp. NPDC002524]|uniref:hypothetical protein n=1 Tax=Streptosporangium sp. NPDC002524 TaxID=3154537 RepID=UPI0033339797